VQLVERQHQIFLAPGNDSDTLPTPSSPWHIERQARLPFEHWLVILQFARSIDLEFGGSLEAYSKMQNSLNFKEHEVNLSSEKLIRMLDFLGRLITEIKQADSLVPKPTEQIPENFTNDEHARMVEAVKAVFQESKRLGKPFMAWVE
jgi:hypothetical protein